MCCSIWARRGKGLSGLVAARVWSRATLEPNLSCHNKMMRSGPERLKSSSKCTQARALPSSCWEQSLLQRAAGHPILLHRDPGDQGLPQCPPSPVPPSCWQWARMPWLHLSGAVPSPGSAVGLCTAHLGAPRAGAVLAALLCSREHSGDTEAPLSRGAPLPSPPAGLCPRGPLPADTGWHSHALARQLPAGFFRRKAQGLRGGVEELPLSPFPGQPAAPGVSGGLVHPAALPQGSFGVPRELLPSSRASPEHHQPGDPCPALRCGCVPPSQSPTPAGGALGGLGLSRTPRSPLSSIPCSGISSRQIPAPQRPPHPGNWVGITTHHLLKGCCQG